MLPFVPLNFQKQVTVEVLGHDRYRRTIGQVTLPDGKSLSSELVKAGLGWWYRKYAPSDTSLQQLEQEAKQKKVGLWQDSAAMAPWEFRHQRKRKYANGSR